MDGPTNLQFYVRHIFSNDVPNDRPMQRRRRSTTMRWDDMQNVTKVLAAKIYSFFFGCGH